MLTSTTRAARHLQPLSMQDHVCSDVLLEVCCDLYSTQPAWASLKGPRQRTGYFVLATRRQSRRHCDFSSDLKHCFTCVASPAVFQCAAPLPAGSLLAAAPGCGSFLPWPSCCEFAVGVPCASASQLQKAAAGKKFGGAELSELQLQMPASHKVYGCSDCRL